MFERTSTYTYLTPDQRHYVIDRSLEEAGLEEGPARLIEERFPAELAQWRSLDQRSLALQGNDLDHNPARRHLFAKTTAALLSLERDLTRLCTQATGIPDAWKRYQEFTDTAGAIFERANRASATARGVTAREYTRARINADPQIPTLTGPNFRDILRARLEADPDGPWHPERLRETPEGGLSYRDEYGWFSWSRHDASTYALTDFWAAESIARELDGLPPIENPPEGELLPDRVSITLDDGEVLSADSDVLLAAALAERDLGVGWEEGLSPTEEHFIMEDYLDTVAEHAIPANADAAATVQASAEPGLTIYTTPTCPGCQLTKSKLTQAGVDFTVVDLTDHPELIEQFKAEGLLSAPIIETPDGARTSGFRPDRIKAIIATANTTTNPAHPTPPSHRGPTPPTATRGVTR